MRGDIAAGEKIDFFLGEIERGLDVDAQLDDRSTSACTCWKTALQRTHRRARGRAAAGFDQVGDGLGLGQVDLAVQKCALGEFPGPRQAAPSDRPLQQHVQHDRPAVRLQLDAILPAETVRRPEVETQTVIYACLGIEKAGTGSPGLDAVG